MSEKRERKKGHSQTPAAPLKADQNALSPPQAAMVLAIGLAFGLGVIYERDPLNGLASLTHWGWPWQDLGTFQIGLALLAPFLLIAFVLWRIELAASQIPVRLWLAALVLANFCLQLFSVLGDPRGVDRISKIVASADATSYFTDALSIQQLADWMKHFDAAALHGHSLTHPAGPILFYYIFLRLFGPETGALLGGCAVGLIASLGVAVMYYFAELWTPEPRVRLLASAFYALIPGLVVFFPELDQMYPLFSMLIILAAVKAFSVPASSYKYALALGALLFAATLFAYNLLAVGIFILYYGMYWWWRQDRSPAALFAESRAAAIALTGAVSLYVLLWLSTGYNPVASLRHAFAMQAVSARSLNRPYAVFVFADLYDFALGAGIIALPILWFYLRKLRGEAGTALTLIGLATVLTVDLSGMLRGEAARVWLFLQPFLIVPVAIELARARWPWRLSIFTLQWWILVCLKSKMSFVEP